MKYYRSLFITALSFVGAIALAFALTPLASAHATTNAAPQINTLHYMGIHGSKINASPTSSNMTYQGGPVETTPVVYISWWGPQWSTGFSTGGYTSAQAQTYNTNFFGNLGGSGWNNIDTQYCQGVAVGTVNCGTSGIHITNGAVLGGTWVDTTSLPKSIKQSNIASAAVRLMNHFGYNANATYFVFTPSGHSMSGFGTQWCAWHSVTSSTSGNVAYAYMPYIPDAGASCGMNYVNATNNSYGNGYFDGFSIVGGHEYAEAATDPVPSSGSIGWQGPGGGSDEIGDKCAWTTNGDVSQNITLGSNSYAVQELWSNAVSACAISY